MAYSDMHARALTLVTSKGAAVTFTRKTQGSYDPETNLATVSATTVAGQAVRARASLADRERYAGLGLSEAEAPMLVFVPTTYGEVPSVGDVVTWASVDYTVRNVEPVAPDGTVLSARVIVAR